MTRAEITAGISARRILQDAHEAAMGLARTLSQAPAPGFTPHECEVLAGIQRLAMSMQRDLEAMHKDVRSRTVALEDRWLSECPEHAADPAADLALRSTAHWHQTMGPPR